MKILGIDPGTHCGWGFLGAGQHLASGVWDLSGGRHEGGGMRYLRLRRYLYELLATVVPDAVAYEEVRRHQGTDAAHIYGGVIGVLTQVCEEEGIPYRGIPVGTIKKRATGRGNAGKPDMIKAANTRWSLDLSLDFKKDKTDNQADALWAADTLYEELKVDDLLPGNANQ